MRRHRRWAVTVLALILLGALGMPRAGAADAGYDTIWSAVWTTINADAQAWNGPTSGPAPCAPEAVQESCVVADRSIIPLLDSLQNSLAATAAPTGFYEANREVLQVLPILIEALKGRDDFAPFTAQPDLARANEPLLEASARAQAAAYRSFPLNGRPVPAPFAGVAVVASVAQPVVSTSAGRSRHEHVEDLGVLGFIGFVGVELLALSGLLLLALTWRRPAVAWAPARDRWQQGERSWLRWQRASGPGAFGLVTLVHLMLVESARGQSAGAGFALPGFVGLAVALSAALTGRPQWAVPPALRGHVDDVLAAVRSGPAVTVRVLPRRAGFYVAGVVVRLAMVGFAAGVTSAAFSKGGDVHHGTTLAMAGLLVGASGAALYLVRLWQRGVLFLRDRAAIDDNRRRMARVSVASVGPAVLATTFLSFRGTPFSVATLGGVGGAFAVVAVQAAVSFLQHHREVFRMYEAGWFSGPLS